jgi:Tol biopolymer transport system component
MNSQVKVFEKKQKRRKRKMKLGKLLLSIVIVSLIVSMAIPMAAAPKPDKPPKPPPGGDDPPADPVIAFRTGNGPNPRIDVMNADGSNQATVFRGGLSIGQTSWSPYGNAIAVQVNVRRDGVYFTDLYRIDISIVNGEPQGSEPIVLVQDIASRGPAWSPNGDVIAFIQMVGDNYGLIQTIPADGGPVETIYTAPDGYNVNWPTWNSDATKMVFTQGASGQGSLMLLDLSDGSTTSISMPISGSIGFIDWARTKDVLAFYMIPTAGDAGIYLLDLTETSPTPEPLWVDDISRSPSWSPDDSQLVFDTRSGPRKGHQISVYTFSTEEIEYYSTGMHPDWCRS